MHASPLRGRPPRTRLVPLGPAHLEPILAGQDEALAREVFGRPWTRAALAAFLTRAERWSPDGPICEWAALDDRGQLIGGGGVHRVGAGVERGQADVSYWVLGAHRGRGCGRAVAAALVENACADARTCEVVLRIAPDNAASAAVARGLGARPTGIIERHPADGARRVERWILPLS